MKTIERFGAWVSDIGWLWLLVLIAFVTAVYSIKNAMHTVPISEEHFECTATDAVGIKARCVQFTALPFYRDLGNRSEQ